MEGGRQSGVNDRAHADAERAIAAIFALEGSKRRHRIMGMLAGIPYGSPISPLPANLYMRRFVLGWKKLGLDESFGTRIVTYTVDLVIRCSRGNANARPKSAAATACASRAWSSTALSINAAIYRAWYHPASQSQRSPPSHIPTALPIHWRRDGLPGKPACR